MTATIPRSSLLHRGWVLAWLTIGWNTVEGVAAIASGSLAGSIALIGFGVDSFVEVFAGAVIVWRISAERRDSERTHAAEARAVRLIAVTFLALAGGVAFESARRLVSGEQAETSDIGIIITSVSLVIMPALARAKSLVGRGLGSRAVQADATETALCVWLSAFVLAGLVVNAAFGWWWADPIAAFAIVYIAAREGLEHLRTKSVGDCCWPGSLSTGTRGRD